MKRLGARWATCYRFLLFFFFLFFFFFLLIALQAQALDNMKRQKGYCAATRTTHIRSWVREGGSEGGRERKKKARAEQLDVEWKKWRRATEAPRQREGWTARARNAGKKIQGSGERDGAIYGRLVVMVISREGEEGMKLSG